MDVQKRVVEYFKNNVFIHDYIKGIDGKTGEVVINYKGETRRMSIDKLETIRTEEELINSLEGRIMQEETPVVNERLTRENPPINNNNINNVNNTVPTNNDYLNHKSLSDIELLTELKNKDGLDNILKEFAVNSETGLIDVKVAINKVIGNTIKEVEKSIINRTNFSNNLEDYDIQGNYVGEIINFDSSPDEKIMRGFNNINVYLKAAKMYPEQVNFDADGLEVFKNNYIKKVKTDLGMDNLVKKETNVKKQLILENPEKNAGFADVFVLTVIVLVYAAIIVNLILKLK